MDPQPALPRKKKRLNSIIFWGLVAFAVVVFISKCLEVFSGPSLGHDYLGGMPLLVSQLTWIRQNGFWTVPHFSPYECAGIFEFADPQSSFYSIGTFLGQYLPLPAVYPVHAIIMGLAGGLGCYVLFRRCFTSTRSSALVASLIFLFNHFFYMRVTVGHIVYGEIMFLSWIAFFALRKTAVTILQQVFQASAIALLFAYMIMSGGSAMLMPGFFSLLIIVFGFSQSGQQIFLALLRLGLGGLVAIVMTSPKLAETFSMLAHVKRPPYLLPGFGSLGDELHYLFRALFFEPDSDFMSKLKNMQWAVMAHEATFSVTYIPLIAIVALVWTSLPTWRDLPARKVLSLRNLVLAFLICLPAFLNVYSPDWNAFLKSLPLIGQTSTLIRWTVVYILPLALVTGVAFQKLVVPSFWHKPLLVVCGVFLIVKFYHYDLSAWAAGYNPNSLYKAYAESLESPVKPVDENGFSAGDLIGNATFLKGVSQLSCYNALFGYRLESLRRDNLGLGPTKFFVKGKLNFHNPACYVFPKENNCEPGDNFNREDKENLDRLLNFLPMEYNEPEYFAQLRVTAWATFAMTVLFFLGNLTTTSINLLRSRKNRLPQMSSAKN